MQCAAHVRKVHVREAAASTPEGPAGAWGPPAHPRPECAVRTPRAPSLRDVSITRGPGCHLHMLLIFKAPEVAARSLRRGAPLPAPPETLIYPLDNWLTAPHLLKQPQESAHE